LQKRDALGAAQEGVEGRNPAHDFVAQQSHVGQALLRRLLNRRETIAENAGLGLALVKQRHGGKHRHGHYDKDQHCNQELHGLDLHPGFEQ
jgi:hypothetical protein